MSTLTPLTDILALLGFTKTTVVAFRAALPVGAEFARVTVASASHAATLASPDLERLVEQAAQAPRACSVETNSSTQLSADIGRLDGRATWLAFKGLHVWRRGDVFVAYWHAQPEASLVLYAVGQPSEPVPPVPPVAEPLPERPTIAQRVTAALTGGGYVPASILELRAALTVGQRLVLSGWTAGEVANLTKAIPEHTREVAGRRRNRSVLEVKDRHILLTSSEGFTPSELSMENQVVMRCGGVLAVYAADSEGWELVRFIAAGDAAPDYAHTVRSDLLRYGFNRATDAEVLHLASISSRATEQSVGSIQLDGVARQVLVGAGLIFPFTVRPEEQVTIARHVHTVHDNGQVVLHGVPGGEHWLRQAGRIAEWATLRGGLLFIVRFWVGPWKGETTEPLTEPVPFNEWMREVSVLVDAELASDSCGLELDGFSDGYFTDLYRQGKSPAETLADMLNEPEPEPLTIEGFMAEVERLLRVEGSSLDDAGGESEFFVGAHRDGLSPADTVAQVLAWAEVDTERVETADDVAEAAQAAQVVEPAAPVADPDPAHYCPRCGEHASTTLDAGGMVPLAKGGRYSRAQMRVSPGCCVCNFQPTREYPDEYAQGKKDAERVMQDYSPIVADPDRLTPEQRAAYLLGRDSLVQGEAAVTWELADALLTGDGHPHHYAAPGSVPICCNGRAYYARLIASRDEGGPTALALYAWGEMNGSAPHYVVQTCEPGNPGTMYAQRALPKRLVAGNCPGGSTYGNHNDETRMCLKLLAYAVTLLAQNTIDSIVDSITEGQPVPLSAHWVITDASPDPDDEESDVVPSLHYSLLVDATPYRDGEPLRFSMVSRSSVEELPDNNDRVTAPRRERWAATREVSAAFGRGLHEAFNYWSEVAEGSLAGWTVNYTAPVIRPPSLWFVSGGVLRSDHCSEPIATATSYYDLLKVAERDAGRANDWAEDARGIWRMRGERNGDRGEYVILPWQVLA